MDEKAHGSPGLLEHRRFSICGRIGGDNQHRAVHLVYAWHSLGDKYSQVDLGLILGLSEEFRDSLMECDHDVSATYDGREKQRSVNARCHRAIVLITGQVLAEVLANRY